MGYSFYLISKEKEISQNDFDTAMVNLSKFNRQGHAGMPPCDIDFKNHYIRVSGSFGVSGQYAEGFVLNLLMCLLDLDYKPKVISIDWEYGTEDDWKWLDGVRYLHHHLNKKNIMQIEICLPKSQIDQLSENCKIFDVSIIKIKDNLSVDETPHQNVNVMLESECGSGFYELGRSMALTEMIALQNRLLSSFSPG